MRLHRTTTCIALALAALTSDLSASVAVHTTERTPSRSRMGAEVMRTGLPLHFEANRGQTDAEVRFLARCRGYTAFLTASELVLSTPSRDVVRTRFPDSNPGSTLLGLEGTGGASHYFVGDDPDAWVTDATHHLRVVRHGVYPGVDLHWYGGPDHHLRYEFHVAPGADPDAVVLQFDGVEALEIDDGGDLLVATAGGTLRHSRPVLFQDVGGRRRSVPGRFELRGDLRVGLEVGNYDRRHALVIDPEIQYSTYLGGNEKFTTGIGAEGAGDIVADGNGVAYVVGKTDAVDFPIKSAYQSKLAGGLGQRDAFVSKINSSGTALVFSTFLGGSQHDGANGVALDSKGAVYVTGGTRSQDFPVKSAFQTKSGGNDDGFVAKLGSNGSTLTYASYLGGSLGDGGSAICVDSKGAAYVTGYTNSTNFPTKAAIQGTHSGVRGDAFLCKVNASGAALTFSTYLGGTDSETGRAIALDAQGAIYVTGRTLSTDFPTKSAYQAAHKSAGGGFYDAYVTKFNAAGTAHVFSTYLGGGKQDVAWGLAVDGKGNVYVAGTTGSTDFPIKGAYDSSHNSGPEDVFVTKLAASGQSLVYSTYLGGSKADGYSLRGDLAVDKAGAAYVAGHTESNDFPTVSPLQATFGGQVDAFVTKLGASGAKLEFSTYLGGSAHDEATAIHVDASGAVYTCGMTRSSSFKTVSALQKAITGNMDAIVVKLKAPGPPAKPTDLVVIGSTDARVDLQWKDNSPNEARFDIERAVDDGPFEALASPAAETTTYGDDTVAGDTTYHYRVRAANTFGASDWSNEVAVATIASPDQLAGTPVSNSRIDLMWRDRSGSEDGFEVERKRAGDDDYLPVDSVAANVTSLADAGVDPETTYLYRVRATKGSGASGWSNVAEATTPPADPADVIPTNHSDAAVRIRWKDLSEAETGYEVERGVGCPAASYSRLATVGPDVTELLDGTAQPETTYSYRVRAVNQHGHSEYTAPVCITTAPTAPSGFAGNAMSPSRIRLTWQDNSGIEQGYEVQRTEAGREEWQDIADLPADATEYVDVGVSQEAAFSYRVRAYDDNGRSRNAMAEGVSTPAALVVRSARLTIPTGRAAKRKKPTLVAKGEMDVGGTQVDFEGAATLWVGDTQVAIGGLDSLRRGKLLRFDENGIRLDLKPSAKGASRVPFSLKVVGDVAAALDKDGELFLRFRSGAFDAMGVVTLAGGQFNPARGKGTWIDPELNLLSVAATPKRGSFRMKATFPPAERPDTAPEVSVLLDIFEISFEPSGFKQRGATKYVLSRKLGPVRQKVILDYRRGTLSITLNGVALQTYEPGTVLVPLAVSIGTTRLEDRPMLVTTKRSFRY